MRLILTTIILTMLAQPVWAQTVFFCVMTEFASVSDSGTKRFVPERFKMSVDQKNVKFGSGGYLDNAAMEVTRYFSYNSSFYAKTVIGGSDNGVPLAIAKYEPPNFYFSSVMTDVIDSFHATCDKF